MPENRDRPTRRKKLEILPGAWNSGSGLKALLGFSWHPATGGLSARGGRRRAGFWGFRTGVGFRGRWRTATRGQGGDDRQGEESFGEWHGQGLGWEKRRPAPARRGAGVSCDGVWPDLEDGQASLGSSILVRRDDLVAGPGRQGTVGDQVDGALDEVNRAIGEGEIHTARVEAPERNLPPFGAGEER